MIITIISWLIIGLIAGWLASNIMGAGGYGVVGDIVVGLIGAVIGGFLVSLLRPGGFSDNFDTGSFILNVIVAVIGAVILIAILRAVSGSRAKV